jgi:hypothetical protein
MPRYTEKTALPDATSILPRRPRQWELDAKGVVTPELLRLKLFCS